MKPNSSKSHFNLRGREFTKKDINIINKLVEKNYEKGRTFISIEVCKRLDWQQPNGWLKDRACREVLRVLDENRLIKLPKSKIKKSIAKHSAPCKTDEFTSDKLIKKRYHKSII